MPKLNLSLLSLCALQEMADVCDRELAWIANHPIPCEKQLDNVCALIAGINYEMDRRVNTRRAAKIARAGR